jgi:hypothetical protein
MKHLLLYHFRTVASGLVLFIAFMVMPPMAQAAEVGPICVLLLKTDSGSIVTTGVNNVLLHKGDDLEIYWFSGNATRAENTSGDKVSLSGKVTVSPQKKTTYTYTFSKGTKEMECSVVVSPVEGSVTERTLSTKDTTPTISGTAKNTKTVSFEIFKSGSKKPVYESGVIKVIDGAWKETVSDSLPKGVYTLVLSGSNDLKLRTIVSEKLMIGTTVSADTSGVIVVQPIPLLVGGVAKRGQTVGLSYLQVLNVGLKPVTITGIRVKQTGTASTDTVVTLTATDDTELHKGQVGKMGVPPFKSEEALIPVTLTLGAKETRLFTLKAILGSDITDDLGKTLKLVVSAVESESSIKGTFPIKGVLWTLGR